MARRLGVLRLPRGESRILTGVPPLGSLTAGSCALVRALMGMLAQLERPASYDALMGLTGLAFVTPVEDDFRRPAADRARCARIGEALAVMGLRGEVLQAVRTGAEEAGTSHNGGEDFGHVYEALERGVPVPVLGWPRAEDDWGVVAGYDRGRGVWCGRPHGYDAEAYLGAPPAGEAFVIVGETMAPAQGAQAVVTALERAVEGRGQTAAAYERRVALLDDSPEQDADAPAHVARVTRHERATEALADARTAAAGFLRSSAGLLGPAGEDWALAAAEAYETLVARIEARRPPLFDARAARALASDRLRARWREDLEGIARLDLEALECVAKGLTSELGPAELGEQGVW